MHYPESAQGRGGAGHVLTSFGPGSRSWVKSGSDRHRDPSREWRLVHVSLDHTGHTCSNTPVDAG